MLVSAYLYPWDVDGDPAAVDRIAGLGLDEVSLAAAYHAVRAVTAFHPGHRIVTRDAAVYYRPGAGRWRGAALRPVQADPGSFERAAARLQAGGLRVNAWAVLVHGCSPGPAREPGGAPVSEDPSCCLRNAYGDRYPWALCAGSPATRRYAAALAAEVAALDDVDAIELEACGWYGIEHGSPHDKTGRPDADPDARWLLSLCFCPACAEAYGQAGTDPDRARAAVRAAMDAALGWGTAQGGGLGEDIREGLLRARASRAEQLLREVVAAVRAAAPQRPVLVHTDPDPRIDGSNPGYDLAVLLGPGGADGIVLGCPDPATAASHVARAAAQAPEGARIAAVLQAVAGLGGRPGTLAEQAAAVREAGATELRLYHAGLASASDLAAIRTQLARLGA
ncbi:MAG TPA: hypothetical protein VHY31_17595 [Streptosporangiaceae bacterium]|nr:hypothetical protein [Streptosporangiaceae bacterium]